MLKTVSAVSQVGMLLCTIYNLYIKLNRINSVLSNSIYTRTPFSYEYKLQPCSIALVSCVCVFSNSIKEEAEEEKRGNQYIKEEEKLSSTYDEI